MLVPISIKPDTFNINRFSDTETKITIQLNLIYFLLLCINRSILYIDKENYIWSKVHEYLNAWENENYKIKITKLLSELQRRNRIIKVNQSNLEINDNKLKEECEKIISLSYDCNLYKIIHSNNYDECTSNGKISCIPCFKLNQKINDSENIKNCLSRQFWEKLNLTSFRIKQKISNSGFDRSDLEKFFIPIFLHAKTITFYDRNIGNLLIENDVLKPFPKNYEQSIKWLLCIIRNNAKSEVEVKIITEIYDSSQSYKKQIERMLITFIASCEAETGIRPIFELKIKDRQHRLDHDRFIFTDQINIFIGRGLDILNDQETSGINELNISIISDDHRLDILSRIGKKYLNVQ